MEINQQTVLKTLPTLVSLTACGDSRNKRTNALLVNEMISDMSCLKKAIMILIMHSTVIPQEEKDRIVKELV